MPLRLRRHVLERVEALVEAAVRRARRVYRLLAMKEGRFDFSQSESDIENLRNLVPSFNELENQKVSRYTHFAGKS